MTDGKTKSSRRAFFLHGGAVLGAGVAATAGATALTRDDALSPVQQLEKLQRELTLAQDREALRQLHLAFTAAIEEQRYEAAAELFEERAELQLSGVNARGSAAIRQAFAEQYRCQNAATLHCAYRGTPRQAQDTVTIAEDGLHAAATFHVEVELGAPLRGNSTVEAMARLQGHVADRRWESGKFDVQYVKAAGQWKVASLGYRAV